MENNSRPTQCERIINYLNKYGSITQDIAEKEFGCKRLPSRINELRKDGYKFNTVMETGKNRFGEPCSWVRYFLPKGDVIGYARLLDEWQQYKRYKAWVRKNAPKYIKKYEEQINDYWFQKGRACEILCKAPHGEIAETLYLVRVDKRIFLLGEKGLEKINIFKKGE